VHLWHTHEPAEQDHHHLRPERGAEQRRRADDVTAVYPRLCAVKVRGKKDASGALTTDAMVLSGSVIGLPAHLWGSLHTPSDASGDTAVDFNADPAIGVIDVKMQNFVGADPLPQDAPAQRAGLPAINPAATQLRHRHDGAARRPAARQGVHRGPHPRRLPQLRLWPRCTRARSHRAADGSAHGCRRRRLLGRRVRCAPTSTATTAARARSPMSP